MQKRIKYRGLLKQIVALIWLMVTCVVGLSQHLEDSNIYSAPDSLDIIHCEEIWLTPGFWAQAGADVHVYIDTTLICFEPEPGVVVQALDTGLVSNNNYVYTVFMREPELNKDNLGDKERIETISYFDGLGRPSQNITIQGSPSNLDIVQPIAYDDFGRVKLKYLPYVASSNTGEFVSDAINDCKSFYLNDIPGHESDAIPFAEVLFDGSPLNRVCGEKGVGASFHADSTDIQYLTNTSPVNNWTVSEDDPTNWPPDEYTANQLYLTEFTDEDGHKTREYKDKLGRVVCKAANDGSTWLNTYYLYDDFGLLRCVVPPKATTGPADLELCYYYTYDHRKRMIEKDLPGADKVYMVYDARDRLVMVLDGNNSKPNKPQNQWQCTEYDNLNRPVKTGIEITNHQISKIRGNFDDEVLFSGAGYSISTVFTETYYDSYNSQIVSLAYEFEEYNSNGLSVEKSNNTKSFVTTVRTYVVKNNDDMIPKTSLLSVTYYEKYGRPSRIIADNHMGGIDVTDMLYNFAGEVIQSLFRHNAQTNGSHQLSTLTKFEYDQQGRLISEKMDIDNADSVIVAAYAYNELGEQIGKYLHGNASTIVYNQKVDYNYNIKGWLSNINEGNLDNDNDLFALNLKYTDGSSGLHNGNIWKMDWVNSGDGLKNYTFGYDGANRIKTAAYSDGVYDGHFNTSYAYDENGNLATLKRHKGGNLIDDLIYQYANSEQSNQLLAVTDNGTTEGYKAGTGSYTYDANGNMNFDPAKNTGIEYNNLNLPQKVDFENNDNLRYIYSAGGTKLRKAIADESGNVSSHFDYSGPFIYENDTLKVIFTSAGRIVPVDDNGEVLYKFEYNLQDHLGNTRVVFGGNDNGRPELLQITDYYPFGLVMNQQNYFDTDVLANKYLYNGKELQDDVIANTKLDWYDYGARFYDPALARWHSVDPLADSYYETSPYTYTLNNPIKYIDPDGQKVKLWFKETGVQAGIVFGAGAFYQWGTASDDYGKTWYSAKNAKFLNPKKDGNFEFLANIDVIEGGFIQSRNDKSFNSFLSQSYVNISLGPIDVLFNNKGVFGISGGVSGGAIFGLISANLEKSYSVTDKESGLVRKYAKGDPDVDYLSIRPGRKFNGKEWVEDSNNGHLIIRLPGEEPIDTGIRMTQVDDNQWESQGYNERKNED